MRASSVENAQGENDRFPLAFFFILMLHGAESWIHSDPSLIALNGDRDPAAISEKPRRRVCPPPPRTKFCVRIRGYQHV